ncbi:TonB-dependent siderophore receptor [Roseisolibacter agri]|uniref:Ligand-gated channel n=1 Tax=Roseisolibacter agri TaxID=2014610 RepID=A0AA37Q844_9BACT|nr:TonB-dependent siderophore receptor [Roseisolibacter agri]GLC28014.1 ligand-gated channel [Roseisolibacter agri]
MRTLVVCGLCCAAGLTTALPAALRAAPSVLQGPQAAVADTAATVRLDIPVQPLADALAALARQTGLRLKVEAPLAGLRAGPVVGTMTPAEGLRRLLAGSGLAVRFADAGSAIVVAAGAAPVAGKADGYALGRVLVTGEAARRRGYVASRTRTATKTDTPLRDTPQAVTVVSRDLIADQAMQGMQDLARYVPGVTMGQGEGHRDAPTIRGNSSTADFFVDGVRDDAQYFRDLYNVERVEALKGANAMIFGRGGGGGVINRVSKEAQWAPTRALTLTGGAFDQRRGAVDVGQGFGTAVAARVNGMYERAGGFRDRADLTRFGVNPTLALTAGARTVVRLGYEWFGDDRNVDRGVPSFRGAPSGGDPTTFFGNPDSSYSALRVHAGTMTVDHEAGRGVTVRNRTRWARYDKFYQNVFPGAVNAAGTQVALSAYANATDRANLFNQTDVTWAVSTGRVRHTLLAGAELGRQASDNYRETGYFGGTATSTSVPFASPTVSIPVTFRQSATDADNRATTTVASAYVQDQVALTSQLQAVVGLRAERFDIRFQNHRNGQTLRRDDRMLSPRAGLVYKPMEPVSVYGSYGVSFLPSSGDQFSSLTATTQTLEPERFRNRELGAKWDVNRDLALTGAIFRLDRTNTSAPDPTDPTRTVQTGSQRTTGWELGLTGQLTDRWQVAGGYAAQRAEIVSTTAAAKAGQTVALVPRETFSLWNRVRVAPILSAGLGVVQQAKMYAAIDNAVTLPGFTRVDGALFLSLGAHARAQLNVENLLDARYYATSHGNNNIMPGAPRTLRLTLSTGF